MKPSSPRRSSSLAQRLANVGLTAMVLVALGCVAHLFGDNIRRLFGMSADALAGDDTVAQHRGSLAYKSMKNFGQNTPADYGSGNTHVAVAPNPTTRTAEDRFSTFAIDVDTASYALARNYLRQGRLPDPASVRVEEWVNAFRYDLPAPKAEPFSVTSELAQSPFSEARALLKVSLQGREIANAERLPAHLVFLVDTSCSMSGGEKLGLAKRSMEVMLEGLTERDSVALVTYAGGVKDVLEPTAVTPRGREQIRAAIRSLWADGGTAMGSGMELAYRHAIRTVSSGSVSRVLVFSDGDANIGRNQSAAQMLEAVSAYVKEGVMLTTVGFGMGNYRDHTMEQLADKGNGQSVYIDSLDEAERVFGSRGLPGTLQAIAKDVKVQVEFDPRWVKSYRLVGYENRDVADEDFRNDAVDGGELGAGHSVTALYEVELAPGVEGELAVVRVRGQRPGGAGAFEVASKVEHPGRLPGIEDAGEEMRFATAVALAADILRGNTAASDASLARVQQLAASAMRNLPERAEFVHLLDVVQARRGTLAAAGAWAPRTDSY